MKQDETNNDEMGLRAEIAREGGIGIDATGERVTLWDDGGDETLLPPELHKMRADETGWVVGTDGQRRMWGVFERLVPGQDVMVIVDAYDSVAHVFEPLGQTRAGALPRIGQGLLLGKDNWEECVVRAVGEVPEGEWQAAATCPDDITVYVRDAAGRLASALRSGPDWWVQAHGAKPLGPVVEWAWLYAGGEYVLGKGVEGLRQLRAAAGLLLEKTLNTFGSEERLRELEAASAQLLGQMSPSDASDGLRMGAESGGVVASACRYARTSAASLNGKGGEQ
jgi:hypothetical protein